MPRLAVVVAATGAAWVAAVGPAAPSPAPAAAPAPEHRAAVVIDTGTQVKQVCVRFREESLTGIEALQRAAADPVLRAFPGKGAAVCSLCGTGCPGDESCLTCDAGGRFWSDSRAPAGTALLRTSGAGASSTTVRDGDVEAWRWGRGATPAFVTVEQVCGEPAPAAPSTTAASAPPATPAPAGAVPTTVTGAVGAVTTRPRPSAPDRSAGTMPASTAAPAPAAGPASADPAPSTAPTTAAPPAGVAVGLRAPAERDGGTGWPGLAAFGAALAGLVAWAALVRRRRRSAGSTPAQR